MCSINSPCQHHVHHVVNHLAVLAGRSQEHAESHAGSKHSQPCNGATHFNGVSYCCSVPRSEQPGLQPVSEWLKCSQCFIQGTGLCHMIPMSWRAPTPCCTHLAIHNGSSGWMHQASHLYALAFILSQGVISSVHRRRSASPVAFQSLGGTV
jgi:hypothetical protein